MDPYILGNIHRHNKMWTVIGLQECEIKSTSEKRGMECIERVLHDRLSSLRWTEFPTPTQPGEGTWSFGELSRLLARASLWLSSASVPSRKSAPSRRAAAHAGARLALHQRCHSRCTSRANIARSAFTASPFLLTSDVLRTPSSRWFL